MHLLNWCIYTRFVWHLKYSSGFTFCLVLSLHLILCFFTLLRCNFGLIFCLFAFYSLTFFSSLCFFSFFVLLLLFCAISFFLPYFALSDILRVFSHISLFLSCVAASLIFRVVSSISLLLISALTFSISSFALNTSFFSFPSCHSCFRPTFSYSRLRLWRAYSSPLNTKKNNSNVIWEAQAEF